jgi:hypothetical protein
MDRHHLEENAVRTECIESLCDDLISIKSAVPMLREVHLVEAAYRSAAHLGWGEDEVELKLVFRRVAACLRWPIPEEIA